MLADHLQLAGVGFCGACAPCGGSCAGLRPADARQSLPCRHWRLLDFLACRRRLRVFEGDADRVHLPALRGGGQQPRRCRSAGRPASDSRCIIACRIHQSADVWKSDRAGSKRRAASIKPRLPSWIKSSNGTPRGENAWRSSRPCAGSPARDGPWRPDRRAPESGGQASFVVVCQWRKRCDLSEVSVKCCGFRCEDSNFLTTCESYHRIAIMRRAISSPAQAW